MEKFFSGRKENCSNHSHILGLEVSSPPGKNKEILPSK